MKISEPMIFSLNLLTALKLEIKILKSTDNLCTDITSVQKSYIAIIHRQLIANLQFKKKNSQFVTPW